MYHNAWCNNKTKTAYPLISANPSFIKDKGGLEYHYVFYVSLCAIASVIVMKSMSDRAGNPSQSVHKGMIHMYE